MRSTAEFIGKIREIDRGGENSGYGARAIASPPMTTGE
jgi:hypothetical protein